MRKSAHYKLFTSLAVVAVACAPVEPDCTPNPFVPHNYEECPQLGTSSSGGTGGQCDPTMDYTTQCITPDDCDGDGRTDPVEQQECVPQMQAFAMTHCNVYPRNRDIPGDGVDSNCDGCDGINRVTCNTGTGTSSTSSSSGTLSSSSTSSGGNNNTSTSSSGGGSCESQCGVACVAPEYSCAADGSSYCNDCIAACHGTHLMHCRGGSTSSGGNTTTSSSSSSGGVIGDQMPSDPHYTSCQRFLPNLLVNGSFYQSQSCGWGFEDHFGNARRNRVCNSTWDCYYESQAVTVGNPFQTQLKQGAIPIQYNRTYRLFIKVWVDVATRPLHIELRNDSSPWNEYAQSANITLVPGITQVVRVDFTANATASASLNFMHGDSMAKYRIYGVWLEQQ